MIIKCNNSKCKKKDLCYRFKKDSENILKCTKFKHFWSIDHKPKKQL